MTNAEHDVLLLLVIFIIGKAAHLRYPPFWGNHICGDAVLLHVWRQHKATSLPPHLACGDVPAHIHQGGGPSNR